MKIFFSKTILFFSKNMLPDLQTAVDSGQPVLKVDVNSDNERGLLGIAIMNNDMVFLYYTESSSSSSEDNEPLRNRVYKYQWNDEKRLLVNPTLILDLPAFPGPNHDGGKLAIGPDNYLYAVIGDLNHDGKLQNILDGPKPDDTGVIFRVNPENGSSASDNPFASTENNRYYAYGIRNSFGIDFDPVTKKLWLTENGPKFGDEINLAEPGFNSGSDKIFGIWRVNEEGKKLQAGAKEGGGGEYVTVGNNPKDLVYFGGKGHYSSPEFIWDKSIAPTAVLSLDSKNLGAVLFFDACSYA
jgi:hypothetical protein